MARSTLARDRCFFVDAFGNDHAGNAPAIRQALGWVRRGGCLAIFPAGEVMSASVAGEPAREAPWNPVVARLVSASGASVLPLWVHGSNSELCHAAGRLHPFLLGGADRIAKDGLRVTPHRAAPHRVAGTRGRGDS